MENEELIPLSQAAVISGLSPQQLRLLARKGRLRAQKIGRDWLTTEAAVRAYMGDAQLRSRNPHKNEC